jgi:hypothetical protein
MPQRLENLGVLLLRVAHEHGLAGIVRLLVRGVEQLPAQRELRLLVHRQVGPVVGVREDAVLGFVVRQAGVEERPVLGRDFGERAAEAIGIERGDAAAVFPIS